MSSAPRHPDRPAATPARTGTAGATERVVQALARAIREGHYPPGERLTEARLTHEYGVARSSVREALRRLAAERVIEVVPHRGAVVPSPDRAALADMIVVREALEGLAAHLAAQRIDAPGRPAVLDRLRGHIAALRPGSEPAALLDDNLRFHGAIVELAGNAPLARQIEQLQLPAFRSGFFAALGAHDWQRSLAEHAAILDAIGDGDGPLAESLMRAHIRRTRRMFEQLPDSAFAAGPARRRGT